MHNVSINQLDATPRPVVAIRTDYAYGTQLAWHSHRRAQLLYGAPGVMEVSTQHGSWVVPQQSAVWIPAETPHKVVMLGVSTRSLYIEPSAAPRNGEQCEVIAIPPLMRQLLLDAVDMPLEYATSGRDGALVNLMMHEITRAPTLPLHIPFPRQTALAKLCQGFLQQPNIHTLPSYWAEVLHISERTFNRQFRAETGMSFLQWRQRVCVVLALSRLAAGVPITTIALDMGYDSPAAFSTMFRKMLGQPPSAFSQFSGAVSKTSG
ncbi:AraC family transcriptional regulator [Ewingella sp. AOP8-B2-18]